MPAIFKNPPDMDAVARLSKDPIDNSIMHTTCVATRLNAGHANNALPQMAQANVNCRIVPGHSSEEIRQELEKVVADPKISVQEVGAIGGVNQPEVIRPAAAAPGCISAAGKSCEPACGRDYRLFPTWQPAPLTAFTPMPRGMPTYCVSGEAIDRDDIRAHGKDERIRVDAFYRAVDFYYQYLKAVTAQ